VLVTRAGHLQEYVLVSGKTIEGGLLWELQKFINNSKRRNKKSNRLMIVFISDMDTAKLYIQFLDQNND